MRELFHVSTLIGDTDEPVGAIIFDGNKGSASSYSAECRASFHS